MSTVLPALAMQRSSHRQRLKENTGGVWAVVLNGAATLHAVWFYLAYVKCYLDLTCYEIGTAHTPYQYRLLLMPPLRWAHQSPACVRLAAGLSHLHAWFPRGVRPESLVEFPVDVAAVAVAGLVTRRIYLAASRTGLLAPAVYPLTLLMIVVTYTLGTMYRLRFVYDLPSLGFFAAGMFLLYFRRPWWQFCVLFAVATVNRETTLFLLVMFMMACWLRVHDAGAVRRPWRHGLCLRRWDALLVAALFAAWCGWHVWVVHRFAANGSESWSRTWLNLKLLLVPASWLQLMSCFAFCGPLLLLWRKRVHDRVLRLWLWVIPAWFVFMLHYGLLLENRIFGELIPLVACCVALGAEDALCRRIEHSLQRKGNQSKDGGSLKSSGMV